MGNKPQDTRTTTQERSLEFPNNALLQELVGPQNSNLKRLEKQMDVRLSLRGNVVTIQGSEDHLSKMEKVLKGLYQKLENGKPMDSTQMDHQIAQSKGDKFDSSVGIKLKTDGKVIVPRTKSQEEFIKLLQNNELVFATGPAGTGKTYVAVAMAVSLLMKGEVERLILSRPAIEAGEKLGFLPGDLKEKVDPYLRPIYDALHDMFQEAHIEKLISNGTIEVAPLAFMRGRTLSHAFIILDEAQNTTMMQMKMFLTRLGEGSRMVVTGDVTQTDLPADQTSGLIDAMSRFRGMESVGFMEFSSDDVVRHPLVGRIVKAYEKH
ncbi:MAG: PhoH family protein [Alphaproteobacteria bacterium]